MNNEQSKQDRKFISFEVTKGFKEQIETKAKVNGVSRSEYIRNALFAYMNK